jgi:hypothetical protein
MRAYEFEATVDNGYIEIPAEYKAVIHTPVKVIVMDWNTDSGKKKPKIPSLGIDMTGYKFDRQEANAR